MDWATSLADERIREAQRRGDFDRLPGAGKPLPEENELAGVPEELRIGFKMLKNAGVLPEEMQLRKDMLTLHDLLVACRQDEEKLELAAQLNAKKLRYRMLMDERGWSNVGAFAEYETQVERKLTENQTETDDGAGE
ncbi:DUF1992 domain-containing protein [Cohnella sp. GCM10027633]|uniref:DnaJ family domain-containing protein n=1 Tax=unclassified Cohnella TaxID=2636738 RepID=UPI0036350D04